MKFGVLQFFSWKNRAAKPEDVYRIAMERIRIMDQTGYDCVWLAEHHFSDYSICPSVHMMGTWVASQTERIRIGMAVSLAAFYNPLRLAEEVALLDILSGGRVNWGAGRGFDRTEFEAFGVPVDESYARYRENVDIVIDAWNNERLSFDGKFNQFHDVEVLPKPLQQPHPPVWLAASSPDAVRGAAEAGHAILMDPHASHADIGAKYEIYRETMQKHGYDPNFRDTPMARFLAVADTEAEATEIARKGAGWLVAAYINPDKFGGKTPAGFADPSREDAVEVYLRDRVIAGTPDSVRDQLDELHETMHLNYLLCAPLSPGTFDRFTEQVLPAYV